MHIDLFVDSLVDHFRRFASWTRDPGRVQSIPTGNEHGIETRLGKSKEELWSSGPFSNAHHFVVNYPTMIDQVQTVNMISGGKTVLEHLEPYTTPDAAMDSSARYPPPQCHPGTRKKIGAKLDKWLGNNERQWNMIWLHGPAGTGKSAVAQTFAEHCSEKGRLGAAFFLSRLNNRDKADTIIPTLVYQFAVRSPAYKSVVADELVNDPQLLRKAPRVQFKRLLVDPFLQLQTSEQYYIPEPFIIILDGLDECEGEQAQLQLVNIISEATQLKNLPLLWLICSRPEAHLKYTFSRVVRCGREELLIDAECRGDVDRYLRDGLATIKTEYEDITTPSWPLEEQFHTLSKAISGFFIFASTALKYIGDSTYANPVRRLHAFLAFLKHVEGIGTTSPLETLDLLYIRILTDVPDETLPVTQRILFHCIYLSKITDRAQHAQVLGNFLRLDQSTFYSALRKLHSIIEVPIPEDACRKTLRFYHASFEDFLLDANRSGRFFVDRHKATIDIAKSCLFWHELDRTLFHTTDGWDVDEVHDHESLPALTWVSPDNERNISRDISTLACFCWEACSQSGTGDHDLLSQIHEFDFRYIPILRYDDDGFLRFVDWLHELDPSSTILRTAPIEEADSRLMGYFKILLNGESEVPALFPLHTHWVFHCPGRREYFLLGHGPKSIIAWTTENNYEGWIYTLNPDKEPSEQQIATYRGLLSRIKWCERPGLRGKTQDRDGRNTKGEVPGRSGSREQIAGICSRAVIIPTMRNVRKCGSNLTHFDRSQRSTRPS